MQKYGLIKKVVTNAYYVLLAGRSPQDTQDKLHELLVSQQFNQLYDRLYDLLSSLPGAVDFFLFERKDCFILFLPQQMAQTGKEVFLRLERTFRQFFKEQYQGIGVSSAVPTEKVRQGYFEAVKALAVSQLSADRASCFFEDLGILRFFFDRSGELDLSPLLQVYCEYILPIIQYDDAHSGELFPTLTTYLGCCSSPSATCAALYIHKNTLYSRLNKIAQLLGKSLSDSETNFNISLGVKIHTLVKTGVLPCNFSR